MQIIINQSEIESAIRTYVQEQINVKPGMQIDIDLKATRGAEGATAIIDISPMANFHVGMADKLYAASKHVNEAVQEPKKKEAEPAAEIKATPAKLFQAAPLPRETALTQEQQEAITACPATTDAGYQPSPADSGTPIPEVVEVPVPARTSLFAGLKKPVNA